MNIDVSKEELIGKLIENRRQHVEVYTLAKEGYQKALIKELKKQLERAEAGEDVHAYLRLEAKPESHGADYDRAIAMIELSSGDSVVLDAFDFSHFILDQWDWKAGFTAGASSLVDSGTLSSFSNYS